jgi:polysaccharide biosynthesis protein PslJ
MSDLATLGGTPSQRLPGRMVALLCLGGAGLVALILVTSYTGKQATPTLAAIALMLVVVAWRQTLLAWPTLLALIVVVVLFVPARRYTLGGGVPVGLEPYRVLLGVVFVAWALALLVDPKTRFRRTPLDVPVLLLLGAMVCSLAFNAGRVSALSGTVAKGVMLFVSFLFVMYFVAGVVDRRRALDRTIMLLVGGATVVAVCAVAEWRTGYNPFNHLNRVLPVLDYSEAASLGSKQRGFRPRAYASAQHSIALGAALVIVMPLGVYLYRRTGRFAWMGAAAALTLGAMATGSRTAVVMLFATFVVFMVVKRRETLRLLPLLLPLFLLVQFAMPGSLGTLRSVFSPEGGLLAEQQVHAGQTGSGRIADLGPSLEEWARTPLFGQGFGTRMTSATDPEVNALILDNQWLGTLLEVGAVGFVAICWLLFRAIRQLGRRARRRDDAQGWLLAALCAAVTAFTVGMLTYDAFSFTQVTLLLFVILGLSAAAVRLADAG